MDLPRKEYPRPQFERKEWINLNGEWSCEFDWSRSGEEKDWQNCTGFERKITVPFCPESKLSGIGLTDFIEVMWYQRYIEIPADWNGKKVLLHFGGVDYKSTVYLDGAIVGRHTGGSSPFTVDLTGKVTAGKKHNLVLKAEDYLRDGLQAGGKQSLRLKSAACSYTRTTGIWRTVWLEAVDERALKQCRIIPDYDNGAFTFMPEFYNNIRGVEFEAAIFEEDKKVAGRRVKASPGASVTLELANPREWNPVTPFLYNVKYTVYDKNGAVIDQVESYAGLRKIHLENGRFYLNNKEIFLRMVLDQGFYEDGIWTAPDDEALKRDIMLAKRAGFNGARLHQKVFDERFLYWADHLGYVLWGEFPNWGMSFWQHFRLANPDYMTSFRTLFSEWASVVERDFNHPSIITWCPLNETSRTYNFDEHRRLVCDLYVLTHQLDSTRPVCDTSGFVHCKTDIWSVHSYCQSVEELKNAIETEPVFCYSQELELEAWNGQPYFAGEYGGVSYLPEDRKPFADNTWGYNKEKLTCNEALQRIIDLTGYLVSNPRIAGYCYTQLTDIEQEQNGIYNYDRTTKFDEEKVFKCFSQKPDWSVF